MLIDFHTHTFPDKIAARTVEVLQSNTMRVEKKYTPNYTDATNTGLLKSMEEHGVDISVVLPIATAPKQTETINNVAAQINTHEKLFSFGSLHPMQDDWETVLYSIAQKGLIGIKLHPEYQQFYIDSPESIRILKLCEKLGLLVTLHTGKDIGMEPPVHCLPERLRKVLDWEINGDNIIAAHMGGWREWDNVEKYLVGTPIMMDTAYVSLDLDISQFDRIVKNHGANKILFATDSPWESPEMTVKYINSGNLSDTEKEMIFSENAKKLLKII